VLVPFEIPTLYTIADARFFAGVVGLLNSLRLTGNEGEVVVLDRGLTPGQRDRLGEHARLVRLPKEAAAHTAFAKPYPHFLDPKGIAVLLDSDTLVVRQLAPIIELAAAGKVCVFPEHSSNRDRWLADWEEAFGLVAPPRRQPYVGGGFVAVSVDRWPSLLADWWGACARIPPDRYFAGREQRFWGGDMDALNAVLMSEVDADAVAVLPEHGSAHPDDLLRIEVTDERTLACSLDGEPVSILHYSLAPKAWEPAAWLRVRHDAYVRLLPRVLFGDDVALRLDPREVPAWLRPGPSGRTLVRALDAVNRWRGETVWATTGRAHARDLLYIRARAAFWELPPAVQAPIARLRRSILDRDVS
jgi:hypothetical protein